jgi:23S rRNA pseudouridine955/2504/2580 synthase
MSGVHQVTVAAGEDGMRLDRWFKAHYPALGHGMLQKLLRSGQVRLDGARAKANARVREGQSIRVPPLPQDVPQRQRRATAVAPEDAKLVQSLVIHRDASVIVIDKPPGLAVQGGSKTERHLDGMLDALTFDAAERPRLVHRLDRDTSGVLVLARTRAAAAKLASAFKGRATRKVYWALVEGVPRPDRGTIKLPLVKAGRAGDQLMVPAGEGDDDQVSAVTDFIMIDHAGRKFAWLALAPHTGRTHQLRVHCAEIGCPIYGDGKYGRKDGEPVSALEQRLHLHARSIAIAHPDGGVLEVSAELPEHMRRTWAILGLDPNEPAARDPFADEVAGV